MFYSITRLPKLKARNFTGRLATLLLPPVVPGPSFECRPSAVRAHLDYRQDAPCLRMSGARVAVFWRISPHSSASAFYTVGAHTFLLIESVTQPKYTSTVHFSFNF